MTDLQKMKEEGEELEDDDEEDLEESDVNWANLIFLPFHPAFRFLIVICVVLKTIMGPLNGAYILKCSDAVKLDAGIALLIQNTYHFACDPLCTTDLVLHILHRQVTDEAVKREFMPKSGFFLFLDLVALIPFYRLIEADSDVCQINVWPNILLFLEFLPVYRIVEYFSLMTTYCIWKMIIGFCILSVVCLNFMTCVLVLLTINGLCEDCTSDTIYDWRQYVSERTNETHASLEIYTYAATYVLIFFMNCFKDVSQPALIIEYFIASCILTSGYIVMTFIILPKLFADSALRIKKVSEFTPRITSIINEAKFRNPEIVMNKEILKFYSIIWNKRNGICQIPGIILELPRYLTISIKMDLVWPVFYHSPVLRVSSNPFRRWLSSRVHFDYKLPNSIFFSGQSSGLSLYYLKSGIVQLMSLDDGTTPLISFTGGTIIGDTSFFIPPLARTTKVVCLTYCEVYYITRSDILKGLNAFPDDRKKILRCAKDRLKHARTLYLCKQHVRGLDRTEDEGIAWVKKRWWGILDSIKRNNWDRVKESLRHSLPDEDAAYHCAKYIGQLVLCNETQRKPKSLFSKVKFPFTLVPYSIFAKVWNKIVVLTVYMVLIIYPSVITMNEPPIFFILLQIWVDFVYIADIFVSLITTIEKQEVNKKHFEELLLYRSRQPSFVLDVLSAIWFECLMLLIDRDDLYYVSLVNRLLKIHILYKDTYTSKHEIMKDPIIDILYKMFLTTFCFFYISCFAMYALVKYFASLTKETFFTLICDNDGRNCTYGNRFRLFLGWLSEAMFDIHHPQTRDDLILDAVYNFFHCLVLIYCQSRLVAGVYLKLKDMTDFQFFVSKMKQRFNMNAIQPDLMRRLNRFMNCQWKKNYGKYLIDQMSLRNEPSDIFNKVHGEYAVKIISGSQAFKNADTRLIRELANKSTFLLMPKGTPIIVFGVHSQFVTWLSRGVIKSEFYDDDGELQTSLHAPGEMLSLSSVFFGSESTRTYITCTDCETLVIEYDDFNNIIKRYPNEESSVRSAVNEFQPIFKPLFDSYAITYRKHQLDLWKRIFRFKRHSDVKLVKKDRKSWVFGKLLQSLWIHPESVFMQYWMLLRCITVAVSIVSASLQAGGGANYRFQLYIICEVCDAIALIDIFFKCFLAYYNENGILVISTKECILHYCSRGFFLDLIGFLPWYVIMKNIPMEKVSDFSCLAVNSIFKFSHIYLLTGYFDYITDTPNVKGLFIKIIKWQIVLILLMFESSPYLVSRCLNIEWDDNMNLVKVEPIPQCWYFKYHTSEQTGVDELNTIFAEALSLAQCGLVANKMNLIMEDWMFSCVLLSFKFINWCIFWYCVSLLVLNSRGNKLFQHSIFQLKNFLNSERVNLDLINRVTAHFSYWWVRTKGINMQTFMNERVGLILKQDISVYFYSQALKALDSALKGGEVFQKHLASSCTSVYFLPEEHIMREMDLSPWLYIVHRGKVAVSRNGAAITTLTTGAIFGQLDGVSPRPVQVSVKSLERTDLLFIPIQRFQGCLNDIIRQNIANTLESKHDYITPKSEVVIDSYSTVDYELRSRITFKFPWSKVMKASSSSWIYKWLFVVWILSPTVAASLSLIIGTLPGEGSVTIYTILICLDILHLVQFASDFYITEYAKVEGVLVVRPRKLGSLKHLGFYLNLFSLVTPCFSILTGDWKYQLARLIRIHLVFRFYFQFCRTFKRVFAAIFIKIIIALFLLHMFTCAWIHVACRDDTIVFNPHNFPPEVNKTIYYKDWQPGDAVSKNCVTLSKTYEMNDTIMFGFLKTRSWEADYIVSLTYILILYAQTDMNTVISLTLKQIYLKIFLTYVLSIVCLWITSLAISSVYAHYRELYQYQYQLANLLSFLKNTGLSPTLLANVKIYCSQLWDRHRGNWFPKLMQQAPPCLREDIFLELYHHHLISVPLFRLLPDYFIRQMVARLRRVVIFPGKCIIKEGDIFSSIYFIHEGEVEKWFTDSNNESKMVSQLSTNGYFGLIPGLFPKAPHQFSYMSRTVVDLVYLRIADWEDLLNGYPEVRHELYAAAKQLKKEVGCL